MAKVRVFGYSAMVQIQAALLKQFTGAGVFVRQEPYLWSQSLTLNGATPVTTSVNANDTATIAIVEVDDDTQVRYEVLAPGGTRVVGTLSPKGVGEFPIQWFKGGTISFVDASAV